MKGLEDKGKEHHGAFILSCNHLLLFRLASVVERVLMAIEPDSLWEVNNHLPSSNVRHFTLDCLPNLYVMYDCHSLCQGEGRIFSNRLVAKEDDGACHNISRMLLLAA